MTKQMALVFASTMLMSCGIVGPTEEYFIPEGFNGAVLLIHNQPDGATDTLKFEIPSSGILFINHDRLKYLKDSKYYIYSGNQTIEIPYARIQTDPTIVEATNMRNGSYHRSQYPEFGYTQFFVCQPNGDSDMEKDSEKKLDLVAELLKERQSTRAQ